MITIHHRYKLIIVVTISLIIVLLPVVARLRITSISFPLPAHRIMKCYYFMENRFKTLIHMNVNMQNSFVSFSTSEQKLVDVFTSA